MMDCFYEAMDKQESFGEILHVNIKREDRKAASETEACRKYQ